MEPGDSESLRWTEGRFQMKAIVYESGGVETLGISQVPDPVAGPGEVVVRVRACAMNHADVWGHKSEGPRFGGPRILGRDVAGVIEEVGEGVACWAKGDPVVVAPGVSCNVCFHCQHGQHSDCPEYGMLGAKVDGGYAELMKVSAMNLYPKPESLSYEEAASIPLVFITAWRCLVEKARVQPGEWVLVNAAGSGVGIAAIQIARMLGARVVTTASSQEKRERGLELGAAAAVDYTQEGWPDMVVRATGGGAHVAVDSVGGQTLMDTFRAMAYAGRVINCGFTAGTGMEFDWGEFRGKRLSLLMSFMGSNSYLHDIMRLVKDGRLKPVVHQVFPFSQVQEAHSAMLNRENFGKIVLTWEE